MSEKKSRLLWQRNQNWKTVKVEAGKINELLTYISMNNITELNELIYAGAKLVCDKNRCLLKTTNENSQTWIGNLTENANMATKKK